MLRVCALSAALLPAAGLPAPDVDAVAHWTDPRCDAVALRSWSYIGRIPVNTSVASALPQPAGPVTRGRRVAVTLDGMVWVQPIGGNLSNLWVLELSEHHQLFRDNGWLRSKYGKAWYEPTGGFQVWELYQQRHEVETAWPLAERLDGAAQMVADSETVALVTAASSGWQVVAYSIRCGSIAALERSSPCGGPVPSSYQPSVASPWLTYITFPEPCPTPDTTCRSMAWLHDLSISEREPLGYLDQRHGNPYEAVVWNASRPDFQGGAAEAVCAWLSLPGEHALVEVALPDGGAGVAPADPATTNTSTLSVMLLPSRAECLLPPQRWRQTHNGVALTHLRGVAGGAGHLFVLLSSDPSASTQTWAVAGATVSPGSDGETSCVFYADCDAKCSFELYPDTVHSAPLRFVKGITDGVMFEAQGSAGVEYWLLRIMPDRTPGHVVCKALDYGVDAGVTAIDIHDDMMMVERETSGGVEFVRADLDRDNDRVWDAVDKFPLSGLFVDDSDNDGIGDTADILHNDGSCNDHSDTDPHECWDDLVVMYTIWAACTALVLLICTAIGCFREQRRLRLASQHFATVDEWISRQHQWEEAALRTESVSDAELVRVMRELEQKYQEKHGRADTLENVCQAVLFLLSISSVLLLVASVWETTACGESGFSLQTENRLAWVDLYTSTIFGVDLAYRWVFREKKDETFKQFAKRNWYDWPSLITDIPGFTTAGALNALTVARLLRFFRVIKIFRVVRLYRRVTHTQMVALLILRYSTLWQLLFLIFLILVVAVILKIVEQEEQEAFCQYTNVLWFCLVTVTTVGYGDMVPVNWFSRLLAMLLMLCGIGIIGVLTATMGEGVRFFGVGKEQLEEMKLRRLRGNWQLRIEILRSTVLYNPILAVFRPFARTTCASPDCQKGGIIEDLLGNIYMSYANTQYKFHVECFVCAVCGRGPDMAQGKLWVQERRERGMRAANRWQLRDDGTETQKCTALLYLHPECNPFRAGAEAGTPSGPSTRRPSRVLSAGETTTDSSEARPYNPSALATPDAQSPARGTVSATEPAHVGEYRVASMPPPHGDEGEGGEMEAAEEPHRRHPQTPFRAPDGAASFDDDPPADSDIVGLDSASCSGTRDDGPRPEPAHSEPRDSGLPRVRSGSTGSHMSPRTDAGSSTFADDDTDSDNEDPRDIPDFLVELSVSNLKGKHKSLNGNYLILPRTQSKATPVFQHSKQLAVIEWSENFGCWRLVTLDARKRDKQRCVSSNRRLLSRAGQGWRPKRAGGAFLALRRKGSTAFGNFECRPIVENAVIQEAGYHKIYDPLDVPVRRLIMNYASNRIRKTFSNAPDATDVTTGGGGGGKFSGGSSQGYKAAFERAQQWERVRHQIKVVEALDARRSRLQYPAQLQDRLELLLRTHRLDSDPRVKNFDLLREHLEYTIFDKPLSQTNGTTVERLFTIKTALDMAESAQERALAKQRAGPMQCADDASDITDWGNFREDEIDWGDCIETTLGSVDKILKEHGVMKHEKASEIRVELEHIALAHDRVLMCQWAWRNLAWKSYEFERPLRQHGKKAVMPPVPFANREQYCDAKTSEGILDPLAAELDRLQRDEARAKDKSVSDTPTDVLRKTADPAELDQSRRGVGLSRRRSLLDQSAVGAFGSSRQLWGRGPRDGVRRRRAPSLSPHGSARPESQVDSVVSG